MVLNDLVDSFCYSQKNAGLKGLIAKHFQPAALVAHFASEQVQFGGDFVLVAGLDELHFSTAPEQEPRHLGNSCTYTCSRLLIG